MSISPKVTLPGGSGGSTVGGSASVASAGDLTLTSPAYGKLYTITGTTEINAITTTGWNTGDIFRLQFASILTVDDDTTGGASTAPILLDGETDMVTAAGSTLELMWNGTDFVELSRTYPGS